MYREELLYRTTNMYLIWVYIFSTLVRGWRGMMGRVKDNWHRIIRSDLLENSMEKLQALYVYLKWSQEFVAWVKLYALYLTSLRCILFLRIIWNSSQVTLAALTLLSAAVNTQNILDKQFYFGLDLPSLLYSTRFYGAVDWAEFLICPINVTLELSQSKWLWKFWYNNLPVCPVQSYTLSYVVLTINPKYHFRRKIYCQPKNIFENLKGITV